MLAFNVGMFKSLKLAIHLTEAGRNNRQDKNEHTSKQETYQQKGEAEYLHANHDSM